MGKNFSIKRLGIMLVTGCMLLGLTSCGESEISTVSLQGKVSEEQIYYAKDLTLDVNEELSGLDFRAYGPGIYYPERQAVETYSVADKKTTVDTYTWAGAPGYWTFEKICFSGSGELFGLVQVTGSTAPYLCKFDVERNLVFAQELAEYIQELKGVTGAGSSDGTADSANKAVGLEVGTDSRAYISNGEGILVFGSDGSFHGEVSFGNVKNAQVLDFAGDAYRNLYVLYEDTANQTQYVAEIDTEESAVTGVQQTIGLTGLDATENGLVAYNDAIVYGYDRVSCALVELFHWADCKVTGGDVYGVYQLADGSLFVAANTQDRIRNYLIHPMYIGKVAGSQTGKADIVIATNSNDRLLQHAISKFNKNNEKYNIIVENYTKEGSAVCEARLNGELAAGMGPDLINLQICDMDEMVENGYLEDLSLYLEESEKISESDFFPIALDTYRVNGMLTAIPQHFSISVMLGNSDYVGNEQGWTLEEMVTFMEQNVAHQVYADPPTRDYFFRYMTYFSESEFVDKSAGTCDFDNELFRRLVDLAEEYPVSRTKEEREALPSLYTNFQNDNGLLATATLMEFQNLQVYDAALNGKMTCIGYPDAERIGVGAYYFDAFAISSNSPNKDGAWEFLEYYLTLTAAETLLEFPTYRPSLDFLVERAMAQGDTYWHNYYDVDEFRYMKHPSTQEEIDEVMALLEAARPQENEGWGIINIIMEELDGYYAGEITLDAAIEGIEKEVLLYLAEEAE